MNGEATINRQDAESYCRANPDIGIRDLFKFLFQSCLGCEHLIAAPEKALAWIRKEAEQAEEDDLPEIEYLDGEYCRVHLKLLRRGADPETLCRLFVRSAEPVPGGRERLERELERLTATAGRGELPFSREELARAIEAWKEEGFPPVHHSEGFRAAHHPAYRVIRTELLPQLFAGRAD